MIVVFFQFAAVLSFDEEVSKTISLEQCKWMVVTDAAETRDIDSVDQKAMPIHEKEFPSIARVSGPCASVSAPRQSKKTRSSPRSARSSAAQNVRGTYVKSRTGFSKYGRHPPPSLSSSSLPSKHSTSPSSSYLASESISSELFAPRLTTNIDASAADSPKHVTVDDVAASFSHLFTGSYLY